MKNWKSWLKGVHDTEKIPPSLVVTGSAKLDVHKKAGDSLAGRFFEFRLHPLDLKEIKQEQGSGGLEAKLDRLLALGGFPEPCLEGDEFSYNRWKRSHLDIILKQDLIDLENVQQITSVGTLIQLLKKKGNSASTALWINRRERDRCLSSFSAYARLAVAFSSDFALRIASVH